MIKKIQDTGYRIQAEDKILPASCILHLVSKSKKTIGQSIAEYTILIAAVTAALLAMQLYMKRGIQAVVKYSTDQFGTQEYMETDPEKAPIENSTSNSFADSTSRMQQKGTVQGFVAISTIDDNTTTTGVSVSIFKQKI